MEQQEKDKLNDLFNVEHQLKAKTLLTIRVRPKLTVADNDEGMELNDGYEFDLNGALPEVADAIAKFAKELPNNDCGENSDTYFISLIQQYFQKLKE